MNSRERALAALRRTRPDWVPLDGSFRNDVWASLEAFYGTTDAETIRDQLGLDLRHSVIGPSIEIGFDAIHPIQPECMDVADIKRRFGDQVCLHGTVSCQDTLPFGTPEDVSQEVEERIACCGMNGGLILGPSSVIQQDVPAENIVTLYNTAQNYNHG